VEEEEEEPEQEKGMSSSAQEKEKEKDKTHVKVLGAMASREWGEGLSDRKLGLNFG
jgi:hypothetical protein